MNILDRWLGDASKSFLKKHAKTLQAINDFEESLQKLTDEELRAKTDEFRAAIKKSLPEHEYNPLAQLDAQERTKEKKQVNQALNKILPEAFAVVREASRRTVGQRHFDVQMLGGIALHNGSIAEMRTGEGKTLVATLPLYLNSLAGRGVHLVTVNDYLAKLAVELYGSVYHFLGLTVGVVTNSGQYVYNGEELVPATRQEAYACDITCGTNNEFGFDYLRDNMVGSPDQLVQRQLFFAIVDEVDSILVDEARTPLIISGPAEESADLYQQFAMLIPRLKVETDYTVDEKDRAVSLTRAGITKMEEMLGINNIYSGEEVQFAYHLEEALKAHILFKRDKDYVVQEGEVIIVDEFTGRLMPGRRYSEGLHQAIEAKEGVVVQRESDTLATISFQNLFRLYTKLSGMTGTAKTEEEEFIKIYGLEVVVIPTNRPMVRQDLPDQIFATEPGKFKALIRTIKERHETGQPVLVGTISIEKNEELSKALKKAGVPHEVLNAKNHEREAAIIGDAGRKGSVTLATNMAGRGTDIMLGGAAPRRNAFETEAEYQKAFDAWTIEHDEVISLGGLHVMGTERHESRRIDNQLRGRSGRQGDPGSSQFFVSTDDDLMRIFGGDRMKKWLEAMGLREDEAIEHKMLTKSLESAQKRVEGHNFDLRKRVVQYDDVMNRHREVIYGRRRKALIDESNKDINEIIEQTIEAESRHLVGLHASGARDTWNVSQLSQDVGTMLGLSEEARSNLEAQLEEYASPTGAEQFLGRIFKEVHEVKEKEFGDFYPTVVRSVYLRTIDMLWREHLNSMQELRTGIGLQGYAQTDPLVAYKAEGHRLFRLLIQAINSQTVRSIFRVERVENAPAPIEGEASVRG